MNRGIQRHRLRPDLKKRSIKSLQREVNRDSKKFPRHLIKIPDEQIPPARPDFKSAPVEIWRSNKFLLQVFEEDNGIERLSIQKTRLRDDGEFDDNIGWDDLQRLKSECGRGDKQAIEIFPADKDVVNVANMRHLWVLTEPMEFTWRKN